MPWSTIQARLRELRVDDHRIYVGWRSYYRCAPRLHTYARREHQGYDPKDAVINAPVPATGCPAPRGSTASERDHVLSSSGTGPEAALVPAVAAALLIAVLVGPALFVLLLRDDGDDAPETLAVARLPTDVAVGGDTVWVASGREDRILAIDADRPRTRPPATRPAPRRCAWPSAPARCGPRTPATAASRA